MKKKIGKVARKIGKFGKIESTFFYGIFVMDMHNSFFVLFVIVVKKFSLRISQEIFLSK
jgi:hypothetical protein